MWYWMKGNGLSPLDTHEYAYNEAAANLSYEKPPIESIDLNKFHRRTPEARARFKEASRYDAGTPLATLTAEEKASYKVRAKEDARAARQSERARRKEYEASPAFIAQQAREAKERERDRARMAEIQAQEEERRKADRKIVRSWQEVRRQWAFANRDGEVVRYSIPTGELAGWCGLPFRDVPYGFYFLADHPRESLQRLCQDAGEKFKCLYVLELDGREFRVWRKLARLTSEAGTPAQGTPPPPSQPSDDPPPSS